MSLINSWKVVEQFEERMAAYCGSRYAVAVDTCTAAIFLALKLKAPPYVRIPANTYLGVAAATIHAGVKLVLDEPWDWSGQYLLNDGIYDYACRLRRGMFAREMGGMTNDPIACLSFQYRKHLKIGRGGMLLTDNPNHAAWFRKARFLGRSEHNGVPEFLGWHAFMEPERAARGLALMDSLPNHNDDLEFEYPDLREYEVLK